MSWSDYRHRVPCSGRLAKVALVILLVCWLAVSAGAFAIPARTPVVDDRPVSASSVAWGTEVGSYSGVSAYSNGYTHGVDYDYPKGAYGWRYQCVEYVNRFYVEALGYSDMVGTGNAWDHYGSASSRGLAGYENGGMVPPQPGDILCSNGGDAGHVAIVREVTSDSVHVIQQNWYNDSRDNDMALSMAASGGRYTVSGFSSGYPVQGWLRKPGSPPPPPSIVGVGERDDGSIDSLIVNCYNASGGAAIGSPSNYVHTWGPGDNGWIQDFGSDKAITHKTQHDHAVYIHGAIWDQYKQQSGPWSSLGWPLHNAEEVPLGSGHYLQEFEEKDGWISDEPYWGDVTHDGLVSPYDTYSPTMSAGETQLFQLKVKNYGQNTWPAGYVGIRIKGANAASFRAPDWLEPEADVYIGGANTEDVPPQGTAVFSWHMQAPATLGDYSAVEIMLYSLDGQCYVPNVVFYDITVQPAPGPQVGELADHTFDQKFVDCYSRNGGAAVIGSPTSYVEPLGASSPGWVQHFGPDQAILRKDKSYAEAAYTYGSIWHLYTGIGGPDGPSWGPIDWPYWKDHKDPYYSNTGYPAQLPLVDHPAGPVYKSYMIQNFLDTVPYDGWICEAPFWGDKTHDGIVYPFDTYSPTMVAGQTEHFRLMVKNYGQETWQPGYVLIRIKGTYAASFRSEDWWEPAGEVPGTVLIAGSVNEAVPPQGTTVLEWNMTAPATPGLYGPGDTDLTVMLYSLDAGCYVANVMYYHITVVPATPGPDYVISDLRRTDGSGERIQGDTIDLAWETKNQGTTDATSPSTTVIYLSSDATIDASDVVLYQDTVPPLTAGASQARTATLTIPLGILPQGTVDHQFHIGAICDTGNTVAEINEGNNVAGGARLVVTQGSDYAVTIGKVGEGSIKVAGVSQPLVWSSSFASGSSVPVEAVAAPGYQFVGWSWDHSDTNGQTAIPVTKDKYVTATFVRTPKLTIVGVGNGSVTVNGTAQQLPWSSEFPLGSPVTISAAPDPCWGFDGWSGDVTSDQGTVTFAMNADTSITASFTSLVIFPDVGCDQWAVGQIAACVRAGIVAGYPDGTYKPGVTVTRDQMAVYISRALAGGDANVPTGPAAAAFSDVPADYWAFPYIEYAFDQEVVEGYSDGTYKPTIAVDRAQMAVFVARAIATPTDRPDLLSYTPPATATFSDVPTSHWAYKFIENCKANNVVQGYPDGTYKPDAVVTRDQMAVYIQRAFQLPM